MNKYDIVAFEEHWLRECELDKLMSVDAWFDNVTSSAMSHAVYRAVMIGRPFDGVVIL